MIRDFMQVILNQSDLRHLLRLHSELWSEKMKQCVFYTLWIKSTVHTLETSN